MTVKRRAAHAGQIGEFADTYGFVIVGADPANRAMDARQSAIFPRDLAKLSVVVLKQSIQQFAMPGRSENGDVLRHVEQFQQPVQRAQQRRGDGVDREAARRDVQLVWQFV